MFKLYSSGILVGKICDKKTEYLELSENKFVALKSKETPYDFVGKYQVDPIKLIMDLPIYQGLIDGSEISFEMDKGEIYEKNGDIWVQRHAQNPVDIITKDGDIIGFIKMGRAFSSILVKENQERFTPLEFYKKLPEKIYAIEDKGNEMVEMRDGIKLATRVILPKGKKSGPVVLIRTPYGIDNYVQAHLSFVQRGYGLVVQDTRGREDSEGEWMPCYYEAGDGDDTLTWIGESDFCDGNVGMIGGSYGGYVQWAAGSTSNPYLKAMVSLVTSGSPFVDLPYKGGCLMSGVLGWSFAMSERKMRADLMIRDDWEALLKIRPISKIVKEGLGKKVPFWSKWCENDTYNAFWKAQNWYDKKEAFRDIPTFILSGWYDDDNMGTTEAIDLVNECEFSNVRVILGPWLHNANSIRDINNVSLGKDAIRYDLDYEYLNWFEKHLKGDCLEKSKTVEYYSMGDQTWKKSQSWPPKHISQSYYFSEHLNAEGEMTPYTYDPLDPAPHIIDLSTNEASPPGDYKEIEKREDVVTFTSDVLVESVEIAGDIEVDFYASSDCCDTDWVVRVCDVDPEGRSIRIAENMLRAKFRNGFEEPELLEHNKVYNYKIRTSKIANTFKPNHRIRVMITSSASGYIFSNTNTGVNPCFDTTVKVAHQKVYHTEAYNSKIVLPVIEIQHTDM